MTEAMHRPHRAFANAAAGSEYFASEAHYRLLASAIRDHLQQHGGCVVLTGDPAPNCDLLVRQLTVVGPPRCRATAVKCLEQMSAASLMESYRRLVGGTIEAMSRRVASWSAQPIPARGQELDILVLDGAENLGDDVLQQICAPPTGSQDRWPPRLLIGSRALVGKLPADSFDADDAARAVCFDLDQLAAHETGSFIRYQLSAAEGDALDIFKPDVIELIETYADGDPVVVNHLARRLAKIVPLLAPRFTTKPRGVATVARQENERASDAAIVVLAPPAATREVPAREGEAESVPPSPGGVEALAPAASATEEDVFPVIEAPAIEAPAPNQDDGVALEMAASPAPTPELLAEMPAPPTETAGAPVEAPAASALPVERSQEVSPLPDAEPALAESEAAVAAACEMPETAPDVTAEEAIASPAEGALDVANESEAMAVAGGDRDGPPAKPPHPRRPVPTLGFAAAAAIIIAALIVGATYPRDGGPTYLGTLTKFAHSTRLFADADRGSPGVIGASAPVPKDTEVQRLRTTTDAADHNLLIAEEPTASPDATDTKNDTSAPLASSSSAVAALPVPPAALAAPPPTPAPDPPAAAEPPKPAKETVQVAVAAPGASARPSLPPPPPKPEIHAQSAQAVAPAPSAGRPLSVTDIEALLHRGDQLLASNDIIAARHYFELVSEAGDARAALRLGKTYDPAFLQQSGVRGIAGDPAVAKSWYLKAIAAGDKEADLQLLRLMTLYPE